MSRKTLKNHYFNFPLWTFLIFAFFIQTKPIFSYFRGLYSGIFFVLKNILACAVSNKIEGQTVLFLQTEQITSVWRFFEILSKTFFKTFCQKAIIWPTDCMTQFVTKNNAFYISEVDLFYQKVLPWTRNHCQVSHASMHWWFLLH